MSALAHKIETESDEAGVVSNDTPQPVDTSKLTGADLKLIAQRFYTYLKPFMGTFVAGCIAAVLHGAVSGVQPYFIKILMDDVLKAQDISPLRWLLALILASAIIKGIFMYAQGYLLCYAGQSAVKKLRDEVYGHLQTLSISFFERWQAGQIMFRVITDINMMTDIFTNGITLMLADFTVFIFAIGMMLYLNWQLTLIAFIASPAIAFVLQHFGNLIQKHVSRTQNRVSELNSIMQENINGIKVIKSFSSEKYEKERFSGINSDAFAAVMKATQFKLTQAPIVEMLGTIGVMVIIGAGSYLVSIERFTLGELVAFIAYMMIASTPINRITNTYAEIRKGMVSAARVFELLDIHPEEKEREDAVELHEIEGRVEFENVRFSYNNSEHILKGIDLKVEPGQMIAIVGPNGAGKTTLVNLLPRFYELTGGSIKVDGVDIRDIKISSLRKHIGMVLQDSILFSGSIGENIAYADPDVPRHELEKAAKTAHAHDFITEQPGGYSTVIGEGGVGLSGGQKQRISIARTILRDPKILILDEPTSALDQKSEALVYDALEQLMKNRTTFVIAHRLSTIKKADKIVVMDQGKIAETGSHDELVSKESLYKRLYEAHKLVDEVRE
jgi:ATP-binding cassette, subfamily B, bacterial MsbA